MTIENCTPRRPFEGIAYATEMTLEEVKYKYNLWRKNGFSKIECQQMFIALAKSKGKRLVFVNAQGKN
jgi:hypothetical protein